MKRKIFTPQKLFLTGLCLFFIFGITSAQGKVGIGTLFPQTDLHIHNTEFNFPIFGLPELTLSSQFTGGTDSDGFSIRGGFSVRINNREEGPISLATSNIDRLNILADGRIGINSTTTIGLGDLNLTSINPTGFGGMYINSPSEVAGLPLYGYATGEIIRAYHYYNKPQNQWQLYVGGNRMVVKNDGRIGLGTTTPLIGYTTHNQGKFYSSSDIDISNKFSLQPFGFSSGANFIMTDNDGTPTVEIHANESTTQGSEILMREDGGNMTIQLDAHVGNTNGGFLGLYDENEENRVLIQAKSPTDGGSFIALFNSDSIKSIVLDSEEFNGQGASMYMYNSDNELTIELDADANGDGRVITDELEIKGGSDLAEYFSPHMPTNQLKPGYVVSIDPNHLGKINLSDGKHDNKVIGIISGANGIKAGMTMGQKGTIADGDYPIAIAGRVFVHFSEENGTIKPGDFLTTAEKVGYAMKVKNWDKARGSIVGKALSFPDENGYVLVLVQLQ